MIPARLSSTRLPEKPLHPILGRPLIEWVWARVSAMTTLDHALVATDSEAVARVCRKLGAPVELTSSAHASGTDRLAEVAARPAYEGYSVLVNVQGDEPLMEESHVRSAVSLVLDEGWDVGTCATPLASADALVDPSVVKVARAGDGRALYFSRAPIPFRRAGPPGRDELAAAPFLRHLGLYTYTRDALLAWTAAPPTALERLEALEQLRPLERGLRIGVAVVDGAGPGVDTPADVLRMEEILSRGQVTTPA